MQSLFIIFSILAFVFGDNGVGANSSMTTFTPEIVTKCEKESCFLCAPTVQCGETIQGDYSRSGMNVLLAKEMEIGDVLAVKGEVYENAESLYIDIYEGLSVGDIEKQKGSKSTLLRFEHHYPANITFSRSGLSGSWGSFRPSVLPPTIQKKQPWTLLFRLIDNGTAMETGDQNGWFNNKIAFNVTATTQSFNLRGDWKTTSVQLICSSSTQ